MQDIARIMAAAACLIAVLAHGEEIYKWVDKDGKTHYSSRKEDAGGATTSTLRPAAPPPTGSGPPPAAAAANQGVLQHRASEAAPLGPPQALAAPAAAPSYVGESSATKCLLARDILAGKATHRSGAPLDAYDRQVAESDVRTFCGK